MSSANIKIWRPEEFSSIKLSPLETEIVKDNGINKYFIINVWEESDNSPKQVLLQINNLKVLSVEKDVVMLETLDEETNSFIDVLENSIITLCKPFVKKLGLESNGLTYMSIISDFSNKGEDIAVMKLRTSNLDYDPTYFFGAKRVDVDYLVNANSKIIIELVDIQFDLENNAILPGFRLRQMAKISMAPQRMTLSEYSFVDSDSESASVTTTKTKMSRLSQNYDITQTEYMDDGAEDSLKSVNVSKNVKKLATKFNPVHSTEKLDSIKEIYIKPRNINDSNESDYSSETSENNTVENNTVETNSDENNSIESSSDSVDVDFPIANGNSSSEEEEENDDNTENMQDHIKKILSGLH